MLGRENKNKRKYTRRPGPRNDGRVRVVKFRPGELQEPKGGERAVYTWRRNTTEWTADTTGRRGNSSNPELG